MDPISAVSLAGTVVQLLDFSLKLVAKTKEIYGSVEGTGVRNIELENITDNLLSLNGRVQRRAKRICAFAISKDEKALEALTIQCNEVGQELIEALQGAKVHGAHKGWKSVRQALKNILGRDRVEEIYERLKRYRDQIVVLLMVINNAKLESLGEDVHAAQQLVIGSETRVIAETRKTRHEILDAIYNSRYSPNKPEDVSAVSALLSDWVLRASDRKNEALFLKSLNYPRLQERRGYISKAHTKTFNWALEGKSDGSDPWYDLKEWLRKEDGVYWLGGKAGSGKSTLMKYIEFDGRTEKYLKEWAHPMPLVMASFYFWNPGTTMQKSYLGLLQALLYEILSKRPEMISEVFSTRIRSSMIDHESHTWNVSELESLFQVLANTDFDTKFCFIIDGLDEFDGNHQSLVNTIFEMTRTAKIKILASSRPLLVFQDAFQNSPKLMLQDLTHDDIKIYVHDNLYNHPRFERLLGLEPERAPKLVTEIVEKAMGVFLWVHLVVKSLTEGLTNADRIADLQRRLQQLPADLEQYFLHILTSLDSFYLYQASQLFRLALEAQKPLSVLTFSYLDEEDPEFALKREIKSISKEEEAIRCDTIERRLNSRCKGLLESRRRQACDSYSTEGEIVEEKSLYEVDFLHRTVRDFLNTPTVQVQLVATDTASFNANMTLASAFVAQIKGLRRTKDNESNFQALWDLVFGVIYHIGRVGTGAPAEAQMNLLDEMDRAASLFRDVAIVKRGCKPTAHWVNTGYRFGINPDLNNNLLTLCTQYNLVPYVRAKLDSGAPIVHSGRSLLSFAINHPLQHPSPRAADIYTNINLEMLRLLLERGANPNERDGTTTVWDCFLISMSSLYRRGKSGDGKTGTSPNQIPQPWFEATRMLLLHGADTKVHECTEIIRTVFGGNSQFDVTELEDLFESPPPPRDPSGTGSYQAFLHVQEHSHKRIQSPRSSFAHSRNSQGSAMSRHMPTSDNVVAPLQPAPVFNSTQQSPSSNVFTGGARDKKRTRFLRWLKRE